jgi:hypothetical protein
VPPPAPAFAPRFRTLGSLHEFRPDSEDFSTYMERVQICRQQRPRGQEGTSTPKCYWGRYVQAPTESGHSRQSCAILQPLLTGKELTLQTALEKVQSLEAAQKNSKVMKGQTLLPVGQVSDRRGCMHKSQSGRGRPAAREDCRSPCHRCGSGGHTGQDWDSLWQSLTIQPQMVLLRGWCKQ